jgi:hypothetical protein
MNYIENSSATGTLSGVDSLVKGYIKVGFTVTLILIHTVQLVTDFGVVHVDIPG